MNTLHVFNKFVGDFEHLLAILTRKKLTRGLVFSDVNLQIERLGKSNHTLFALEISFVSQMIHQHMFLHNSMIMRAEITLSAIIAMCLRVEFDVQIDLGISWI